MSEATGKQIDTSPLTLIALKAINWVMLIGLFIIGFGYIDFFRIATGFRPVDRIVTISWILIVLALTVFKEFKVKSIGYRILLNVAAWLGFGICHFYVYFVWT